MAKIQKNNTWCGRPKKDPKDIVTYIQHAFYFNTNMKNVLDEFEMLAKLQIGDFPYPERCFNIILRRLMFDFILKKTQKEDVKKSISKFIAKENLSIKKFKDNINI